MSDVVATKLTEIAYFIIPLAFVIVGIFFWEKNQSVNKTKNNQDRDDI